MVKCFNSAGVTSTIYTASTLSSYGGLYKICLQENSFLCFKNIYFKEILKKNY